MAYCQMCADKEVEIRILRARCERLEKVARYAKHDDHCGWIFDQTTQTGETVMECTCGFDAATKELDSIE